MGEVPNKSNNGPGFQRLQMDWIMRHPTAPFLATAVILSVGLLVPVSAALEGSPLRWGSIATLAITINATCVLLWQVTVRQDGRLRAEAERFLEASRSLVTGTPSGGFVGPRVVWLKSMDGMRAVYSSGLMVKCGLPWQSSAVLSFSAILQMPSLTPMTDPREVARIDSQTGRLVIQSTDPPPSVSALVGSVKTHYGVGSVIWLMIDRPLFSRRLNPPLTRQVTLHLLRRKNMKAIGPLFPAVPPEIADVALRILTKLAALGEQAIRAEVLGGRVRVEPY